MSTNQNQTSLEEKNPLNRTIEICNLSDTTNETNLREIFSACGTIETLIVKTVFGRGRICYIKYKEPMSAEAATTLNWSEFYNKILNIKIVKDSVIDYYKSDDNNKKPNNENGNGVNANGQIQNTNNDNANNNTNYHNEISTENANNEFVSNVVGDMQSEISQEDNNPETREKLTRTIYVGNLNPLLSEAQVKEYFSSCGDINVLKVAGTNSIRYAFIEFATAEAAKKTFQLTGQMLMECPIKVGPSKTAIITQTKKCQSCKNKPCNGKS